MTQQIHTPRRGQPRSEPAVKRRTRSRRSIIAPPAGFNWRWVSGLLLVANAGLLAYLLRNPTFVVSRAEVVGVHYVPASEVYANAGIDGQNIMLIDPAEVERREIESPSLQSARVTVAMPARVVIEVQEREPALIWEQGGDRYWVDVNGNLMQLRQDLPDLVRVVNEGDAIPFRCPGPDCVGDSSQAAIDPAVVLGAQQLKTLRSNIDVLYYDPVRGLSYQDGRGWRGYFGTGTDMDVKLSVYETLIANLTARGIVPAKIDVSNLNAPFYALSR